jgi:superfamily II DNA or RNA helicase
MNQHLPGTLAFEPRRWQKEALSKWEESRRGIVQVVTGGGKTAFALLCIESVMRLDSLSHVIVIVPTIALLDQWYVSLMGDLQMSQSDLATYSGEERASEPKRINLMVLNTARNLAPQISSRFPTFLIVDECHRAGSPSNAKALLGPHIATLGLSATPERPFDEGLESTIAPALGGVIYTYDYRDALEDGVITPFDLVNIRIEMTPDEQREYDRLTRMIAKSMGRHKAEGNVEMSASTERLLQQRATVSAMATMRIPVAARIAELQRGKRTIIFHERVTAANILLDVLRARGHLATVYHTGVGPPVRRDNLSLYRRGIFDVLVSCRALDEGINVPETEIAIVASSTSTIRQRIQRLGRVLRPAPGKSRATIFTLYATDQEERRLLAEAGHLKDVASVQWQRGRR